MDHFIGIIYLSPVSDVGSNAFFFTWKRIHYLTLVNQRPMQMGYKEEFPLVEQKFEVANFANW